MSDSNTGIDPFEMWDEVEFSQRTDYHVRKIQRWRKDGGQVPFRASDDTPNRDRLPEPAFDTASRRRRSREIIADRPVNSFNHPAGRPIRTPRIRVLR